MKAEAEAAGKVLPPQHPAVRSVRAIGKRIAAHAADPVGGGRIDHMKVGGRLNHDLIRIRILHPVLLRVLGFRN